MDDKIYLLNDKICSNILMGRGIIPKIKDCIEQCESDTDKSYYIRLNQCLAEIEQYIKVYKDSIGIDYVYDHDHSYGYFAKIVNKDEEKTDTESKSKSNNNEDNICTCDPVDRDINAFYDGEIHYNYQSILTAKINRNNDI